jgi:WhiB family redox-sensing transcriptional regulator
MDDAICAQVTPDVFFPEMGQTSIHAQRICENCPVRDICLNYALEHQIWFGVWGGMTPLQRRRIRRAG